MVSHCSRRERKKDLSPPVFFTSLLPHPLPRASSFHLPLNVDSEQDAQADPLRILLPVRGRDVAELGTPTYARLAVSPVHVSFTSLVFTQYRCSIRLPYQSQPLQSRERSRTL